MTTPRPPSWTAGRDGEAHARYDHLPRAVCGVVPTDPRLAWPEACRCEPCAALSAAIDADRAARKAVREAGEAVDAIHALNRRTSTTSDGSRTSAKEIRP